MKKGFSPLLFLASLGAGGISIMPFSVMQYSVEHGTGLINILDIMSLGLSSGQWIYYLALFAIMGIFGILHIVMTVIFLKKLFPWLKSKVGKEFLNDPLRNAGALTPLLSLAMTFNVVIGSVRFFIPSFADNLQTFMLPALIFWLALLAVTMWIVVVLLRRSFVKGYDVSKINFGWLLYPFTIGMVAVVGAGIAALSQDSAIANTAAFFTFVSATMGFFLFIVKLIALFNKHFASKDGLGEKQFMPSFLIVLPNITLYAIIFFRLTHYIGHQLHADLHWLGFTIVMLSFGFAIRYMMFGLALMKDYFKQHFFKKEYYVTQRGLVCPFVAFSVLGAFAYAQFFQSPALYGLIVVSMIVTVSVYIILLRRHLKCIKNTKKKIVCE